MKLVVYKEKPNVLYKRVPKPRVRPSLKFMAEELMFSVLSNLEFTRKRK